MFFTITPSTSIRNPYSIKKTYMLFITLRNECVGTNDDPALLPDPLKRVPQ